MPLKEELFQIENKIIRNNRNYGNNGNHYRRNFDSTDVALMATTKCMNLVNDIWICDNGAYGQYCQFV
jgi:hypothetical protein